MLQWVRSLFSGGRPAARAVAPTGIHARYDNAVTTPETQRLFWGADYMSAKAANSYQVRRTLRIKSRYEVSNNPYLFGIATNNADDLIGTGPTLQLRTTSDRYNRAVEKAWVAWCAEVGMTELLRTCKLARTVDGEGFLVLKSVADMEHPVKLWPVDVEADQVTTPAPASMAEMWVDGVTLHPVTGRPTHYHVLKHHPGDFYFPDMNPLAVEKIAARHVIHWFPKFRPGQVRGVPVFTPSLELFNELRAYRRAVLGAAELAADFAAVIQQDRETGAYADEDTDGEIEAFKRVPIDRKMMTTLPPGATMAQFRPEHPTTSYEAFQEKCLGEAIRPLSYPLNLALGTSQKFNFSSAKLDHINYRAALDVERSQCETAVLGRLFAAWYEEAILSGAVPMWDGRAVPPHEWHWPGYAPIDPLADAQADFARISNGTDTLRDHWARRGFDWREVLGQLACEAKEQERLGLHFGEPATRSVTETADVKEGPPQTQAARRLVAAARRIIEAFSEDKIKRDDHGRFSETGSSGDSSAELGGKAKGIGSAIKKLGAKAVHAARVVAEHARVMAYRVTAFTLEKGIKPDDVLEDVHDYAKITNDKAMNASIAEHLGIPLNSAVQGAITKIAAFGVVKIKQWIAKRREAGGAKSAADTGVRAEKATAADRAEIVAEILGKMLREMGAKPDQLPKAADIEKWIEKRDAGKKDAEAAKGVPLAV